MEKITVLIVEDEPPTARFVKMLIEQNEKFEVAAVCENAEEALAYLRKSVAPELVITDIRMAEMSGLDLLKKIRGLNKEMYFIIISGYKMFEYAREGIRLNIEDYITKPIDMEEFQQVLNRVAVKYAVENRAKKRDLLIRALKNKEERIVEEILTPYDQGITLIYQSAQPEGRFPTLSEESDVMLAIPYKNAVLIFWSGERASREKKKLEIALSRQNKKNTLTELWIDELPKEGGGICSVRKLYDRLENFIILGEQRSIHKQSESEIQSRVWQSDEELKKICLYIQGENWKETERGLEYLYRRWEQNKVPLGDIRREINMLGEYFARADRFQAVRRFYSEETEYCLRHADSYVELAEELRGIFFEIFEPMNKTVQKGAEKERELVENICQLVEQNMDKNYSLAEISDFYGVSQPYIRKLFKKYTESSYNQYVLDQKIDRAKQMLETRPELLIKDVADALGYEPFYFSAVFNKYTGLTPSEYRHNLGI